MQLVFHHIILYNSIHICCQLCHSKLIQGWPKQVLIWPKQIVLKGASEWGKWSRGCQIWDASSAATSPHTTPRQASRCKVLNSPHAKHPQSWWCNPKSTAISNSPEKKKPKPPRQSKLISDTVFYMFRDTFFKLHSFESSQFFPIRPCKLSSESQRWWDNRPEWG